MPARLRGLLYGHGHMGRHHARRLRERGDVDLRVVDPGQGLPAPAAPEADFAIVATPTASHAAVAGPLLAAGIPTLVEKPLALDLDEARALAAHAHLSVGHIERWNPAVRAVAHVRPRFVEAERMAPWPAPDRTGGRGTDADVLADLMLHDLDLALRFLPGALGDVRAVGVGVLSGRPDIAKARLELGGGVADLTASRVSRSPTRTLRLVDDGEYWSVDLLARRVTRVRWGAGELGGEAVPVPEGDALVDQHAAFLGAVRAGGPMPVPGAEALRVLEAVAAVRAALGRAPTAR
jgi:predicted dehydrogenase